jgi:hypothetical protein
MAVGYYDWSCEPILGLMHKRTRLDIVPIPPTFRGMTCGVTEPIGPSPAGASLLRSTRQRANGHIA